MVEAADSIHSEEAVSNRLRMTMFLGNEANDENSESVDIEQIGAFTCVVNKTYISGQCERSQLAQYTIIYIDLLAVSFVYIFLASDSRKNKN